jgi:hypothetical protein
MRSCCRIAAARRRFTARHQACRGIWACEARAYVPSNDPHGARSALLDALVPSAYVCTIVV